MSATERVVAYIDGFNLYFGIRAKGRRHLWLDLEALVKSLLSSQQQLVAIRYFTASVRNDPPAEQRQQLYLNALSAHSSKVEIRLGRFQEKTKQCRACRSSWSEYEEKETDVSLAVSLVEDGVNGLYDTALIVSADSDMCPAVRAIKRLRPSVRVVAALPPKRRSFALQGLCDATIPIGMAKVRQSQLPEQVTAGSQSYARPSHWR
ncbi:NYN domain-containing protein [Actinomadura fulvescens]|uniref:NYN domain-containing protein n=1 Tax=Actinomadura fulvescens TaxID=46160 RepID=A0ABN3Q3N3_9ACTN